MKRNICWGIPGRLAPCAAAFLAGCGNMVLFDPKGPIGDAERIVIITAFVLMLIVVIPVVIMALWFPWKYRAGNTQSAYSPKWSRSGRIELVVWLIPAAIVAGLAVLVWESTYRLDPYKPIVSAQKPLVIEAVSLDWKWLFIYPEQDIAVVNQMVFPAKVPLSFRITSGTVMTSFFIPQLGSQIYAMAGMQTRLHLMADEPGTFAGQNQQFSGRGYADMNFEATAASRQEFEAWVEKARRSPQKLDPERYKALETPSTGDPVTYFSGVKSGLFDDILHQSAAVTKTVPGPAAGSASAMPMKTTATERD